MNMVQWVDEIERRTIRDNHRPVVWMTNAEADEFFALCRGRDHRRNRRSEVAILGTPLAVIDQPPRPFWKLPLDPPDAILWHFAPPPWESTKAPRVADAPPAAPSMFFDRLTVDSVNDPGLQSYEYAGTGHKRRWWPWQRDAWDRRQM